MRGEGIYRRFPPRQAPQIHSPHPALLSPFGGAPSPLASLRIDAPPRPPHCRSSVLRCDPLPLVDPLFSDVSPSPLSILHSQM
eukprot:1190969-Prorocentrum_minimum.AAC.6